MHTHYRTPCGWTGQRIFPRTRGAVQLFRPRGIECDGCTRDGVTQYAEGGAQGELCRVYPYTPGEVQEETPRRSRRRVETAVGDERGDRQATLF